MISKYLLDPNFLCRLVLHPDVDVGVRPVAHLDDAEPGRKARPLTLADSLNVCRQAFPHGGGDLRAGDDLGCAVPTHPK